MTDLRDHDRPIWALTMAGMRTLREQPARSAAWSSARASLDLDQADRA